MKETAPFILRRTSRGLEAVDAMDHERLQELPLGKDVEVVIKYRKRSLPQLRAYWAGLHELVKATESYPTAEHLHEAIKWKLGYVQPLATIGGGTVYIPDSAAFSAMDAGDFKVFLDQAQKLCLETWGFNIMGKAEREVA